MILPIIAFGNNVLKTKAAPISADYPELKTLINNMWNTMYNANGVGIAAPQIGKSIRLFIVDASPFSDDDKLSDYDKKQFEHKKNYYTLVQGHILQGQKSLKEMRKRKRLEGDN